MIFFIFSLFDTPCIRYNKLQNEMKDFLIIQFGLTTFRFNSDKNQYVSSTYSFYLKPSTFFDKNLKFSCGVQSMEYLYENNFDFKKVITKGISYVNLADTKKIFNLLRDSQYNEQFSDKILPYFNKVREWITSNEDSKELILEVKSFVEADLFHLHVTIRRQFCNVWTYYCSPKSIKVMKVSKSEKKNLEKETSLEEKILDSILGFSKIMREIKNLQKPLIGHNCLVDLMMIYKQFYNPDPVSYKVFKKSILKIFPKIFDTKYLVKQLNSTLPKEYTSTPKSLADLYFFCKSSQKSKKVPFSPLISPKEESVWNGHFHDAGFDSFCTGYCFLKMAFMFFCWNEVDKKFRVTTMTSSVSLLSSVDCFNNRLYSANGLSGIILNGEDTKMEIRTIYIKSKTKEALDIKKVCILPFHYRQSYIFYYLYFFLTALWRDEVRDKMR